MNHILYDLFMSNMDYYYFNIYFYHHNLYTIKKYKKKNPLLRPSVGNINRKKFTSLLSKENNCCH